MKEEVFNLLPDLKKSLGLVEPKEVSANDCSICNGKLVIPFFYEPTNKIFFCGKCEKKDVGSIPLVKIRNP